MVTDTDPNLVSAAAAGDPAALERLVSDCLPLVYNIVGRALPVAADVDDVVQETMLRVVRGLPALRDPYAFRSWLVAVAMNQVRDHVQASSGRPRPLEDALEVADPGADFADLTLTELGLTGQRREVAMATSWLDDDDRELLSLWWLVEAGHLTRGDLVTAIGLEPHHVTVRIARMKAQLEISRAVVRALCAVPICLELSDLAMQWHGRPEPLWRKRFARHTRQCATCAGLATDFVPAERLLVRLPLVPIPFGLADALHHAVPAALHTAAVSPAAVTTQLPMTVTMQPPTPPGGSAPGPLSHSHRRIGRAGARSAASHFAAKAAVAMAATAAVVGAVVVTTGASDSSKPEAQAGSSTTSSSIDGASSSSALTSPTPSSSLSSSSASSTSAASSSSSHSAKPSSSTSKSTMKPTSQSSASSSSLQSSSHASVPPPSTRSTTPSSAPTSSNSDAVSQVLAVINQARADQGLAPLTITAGLTKSAAAHTSVMASGCGLSHQCPGEPALGDRETAAGVPWSSAGENIGDGGPVSDTDSAIASMAVGLTNSMLAEQPPDDGHRKNILSSSFHHIGISVFRDSSGTVWMTQDFSD